MGNASESKNAEFVLANDDDYGRLRGVFEEAGFTDSGVLGALGLSDLVSIRGDDLPQLLWRTDRGTALDTLIRLFLVEALMDVKSFQSAINPTSVQTWVDAGLVHVEGTKVRSKVKLLPYKGLLIAFDLPSRLLTGQGKDYVMGIGKSSLTLANLTIRKRVGATLDLGTGCGIQALLAAGHSEHVFATDQNPRAVRLATFNAKINGLSNLECIHGDLLEPVKEQAFDLVVTNPPFVVSPEMRYIYRDSGMAGDAICQRIVQEAPQVLREGGFCQVLCNWIEYAGEDWRQRLQTWVQGSGCDVWVLRSETRDAPTYASTWIRHTEKETPEQSVGRFERWMGYYEEHGIERIGSGLITMRRSSGRVNWFRADDAPERMLGPCGEHIVRGFLSRDLLEAVGDDGALLEMTFRLSPDVCLDRRYLPAEDGWRETATEIHLTRGLACSGSIDSYVVAMLGGCDGREALKDLMHRTAVSLGVPETRLQPEFCAMVRRLIEHGFLLPS